MLAKVHAFVLQGIDAVRCEVGVDRTERAEAGRKPTIVGLPDVGVKECVDRIRAALFNCGYGWPEGRLVINLAPADLKKEGNALELPIALGILGGCRVIKGEKHTKFLVAGEWGLDGRVRPVKGALSMGMLARELGMEGVIVPADNAAEAAVVPGVKVFGGGSVSEMVGSE